MSTSPDPQSDYEFSFPAGNQAQPPPQKKNPQVEENDGILADIADEAADAVLGGCLWRLITIPFRVIIWVVKEVFD